MTEDETSESAYLPPDHLRVGQTLGFMPVRTFYALVYPTLFAGLPLSVATYNATNGLVAPAIAALALPATLLSPLGAWWQDPPAEHGLLKAVDFFKRSYVPPAPAAPRILPAVYRMPTQNLDTAAQSVRDRARAQWARFLNSLNHPIKCVVRSTPVNTLPMLEELAQHRRPEARELGPWFTDHLASATLLDRDRFLVVPASDEFELRHRCRVIEKAMRRHQLEGERIPTSEVPMLRTLGWNPRAAAPENGPEIHEGWNEALINGWPTRTYALGKLPPALFTDWAQPLLADDEPMDVAIDIYPQSISYVKLLISVRLNQLLTSRHSVGRQVAIEQLHMLQEALERRRVKPFEMGMTILLRDSTMARLKERAGLVEERVAGLGGKLHILRWEQAAGVEQLDPARSRSLGRTHLVETGTVARTYPWSDDSLQLQGGVPWGVAGNRPCIVTPYVPTSRGPHMAW